MVNRIRSVLGREPAVPVNEEKQLSQSYWALVWWRFKRNRMAIIGGVIVLAFYVTCALFAEFFAPYGIRTESQFVEAPPQWPHFRDAEGNWHLRPFVYGYEEKVDMATRTRSFVADPSQQFPIHLFVRGTSYKLLGIIPWDRHLIGVNPAQEGAHMYLLGTDRLGRDQLSRLIYGGRISLSIGLIGVALTLFFGATLGAISGYRGGPTDMFVQRAGEFMSAFPSIPLFMALAAIIPLSWSPLLVYFGLTVVLAFVQWPGLARQVRGLVLSLREREYVLAAQSFGADDRRILFRHLIPGALSHIIVIATLMLPGMILSEVALSWLGLGIRAPMVSWGVLLQEGGAVRAIRYTPWLLFPIIFVMVAILGFNLLGDGLRDATDPYTSR
jgi:peptide/nickel transport system permease protein